jgi:hypothetical protein
MYLLFQIKTSVSDLKDWGKKVESYTYYLENWIKTGIFNNKNQVNRAYFFKNKHGHFVCNQSPPDLYCNLVTADDGMNCFFDEHQMHPLLSRADCLNENNSKRVDFYGNPATSERYYNLIFKLECEFENPFSELVFYPKGETVKFSFVELLKPFEAMEIFNRMPLRCR